MNKRELRDALEGSEAESSPGANVSKVKVEGSFVVREVDRILHVSTGKAMLHGTFEKGVRVAVPGKDLSTVLKDSTEAVPFAAATARPSRVALLSRLTGSSEEIEVVVGLAGPVAVEDRLKAVAAQRLVLLLEEKRAVAAAASEGRSQVEIGRDLGVSQPTVHRLLRQLAADPLVLDRGPLEIIAEAVMGLADRETMLAELALLDPKPGEPSPAGDVDGYVLGAWDEVVDAWERGWLTDDEYEQLARL